MRRHPIPEALLVSILIAPAIAGATPIFDSTIVRFEAPEQSMWAPGGPQGFVETEGTEATSGIAKGSKIEIELRGNAGTVSGNVEGLLTMRHQDVLPAPGTTPIDFMFEGILEESKIRTKLGGGLKVTETLKVNMPWPIPDIDSSATILDYSLELLNNHDFTYSTDSVTEGVTELRFAGLGADVVVAGIEVNLSVDQSVFFEPDSIMGILTATHLESGASRSDTFYGATDRWIQNSLLLDRPGYWYLTLEDLELIDNRFWQVLGGNVSFEAWVFFGKVLDIKLGLDFWESTPFALDFDPVDEIDGGFLIYVVPEPGAAGLLGLGMTLLVLVGGRRLPRA
jgi:hypothetical protein